MGKGLSNFRGKDIIGFDEFANGGLESIYSMTGERCPLIIVGSLERNHQHAAYGTGKFGSKRNRNFFGSRKDIEKILRYSRPYLDEEHPDFFYTTLDDNFRRSMSLSMTRAYAMALITFQFLNQYALNPDKTVILFHEVNGARNSQYANEALEIWLKQYGFDTPHFSRRGKAERKVPSIAVADMTAYYLAALRFFGDQKPNWPYRTRKVNPRDFLKIASELQNK